MTAADCIGDREPHDRDISSSVVNAQGAESAEEQKQHSESVNKAAEAPAGVQQESSANSISLTYSIMTFD
jgi:hypothetical protein